ncbi:MAG TPA: zinc ribbon domain-containing protein [Terriglobales bacterium]|jgi:type IV pilus assembly protein PilA|nr:zinc ribbon domain-containing protein [Terriglobales bacterium]
MRFCPQCGEPGADNQAFCMKCGASISSAPAAPMPYYPPVKAAKSNNMVIILVVVAAVLVLLVPVILIVAAIAIPNLLRARISANESSAAASVRTIVTAAIQYQAEYGHFPQSLDQLSQPPGNSAPDENHAGLIDATLASRAKNGYIFSYQASDSHHDGKFDAFTINADPIQPERTGTKYFFSSEDGVVRWETSRQASAESPPLQ